MSGPRILVGGVGNVLFGDDGFGVEVARRLGQRPRPPGVRVVEFGIRGFDLASALLDGYDAVILVDAARRGGAPGTLYVIEPDDGPRAGDGRPVDPHGLTPEVILSWMRTLAGDGPRVLLVGCEPAAVLEDGLAVGLTAPVAAAVGPAIELVESLVAGLHEAPARPA